MKRPDYINQHGKKCITLRCHFMITKPFHLGWVREGRGRERMCVNTL